MLSQLSKTIKLALASQPEDRAILRARSAVQRFPVIEWRQKIEDFHRRCIITSRSHAGDNAWRESDGHCLPSIPDLVIEDWTPEMLPDPSRPDWAVRSVYGAISSPMGESMSAPSSMRSIRQGDNSPFGQSAFLTPHVPESRSSSSSDVSKDQYLSNLRRSTDSSPFVTPDREYGDFLARANRQIAKERKHIGDPFLESSDTIQRPFRQHSRRSSMESMASIVEEKGDSPLNKAMTSVRCSFQCNCLSLIILSSRIKMEKWRKNSWQNYRILQPTIQRPSCRSKGSWSSVRRIFFTRLRKRSYRALPAFYRQDEILYGRHPPCTLIRVHLVSSAKLEKRLIDN